MNPQNLKPFKKGYDPRREGNGRKVQLANFIAGLSQDGEDYVTILDRCARSEKVSVRDRLACIQELLNRCKGKAPDQLQLSGPDGGPIPYEEMSSDERRKRITELLGRVGIAKPPNGGS